MVKYAALLWDLDGTIVDSLPVIYEALSLMLYKFGHEGVTQQWMREHIGYPFAETIRQMGLGGDALAYYREVYFSLAEKHQTFEGVVDVIAEIYGKIPMVIVSNKSREGVKRTLAPWKGEKWFDLIVCEDDVSRPKPDPEAFEVVKRFWESQGKPLDPQDVLMIGDTEIDEAFAMAVGMEFAYVSWGYGKVEKPHYVLVQPGDLIPVVGFHDVMPLCDGPELDLHGFAPHDVERVVRLYLVDAHQKGYHQVRVIPGKGKGVRKQHVEKILSSHPFVVRFRESHPLWGGWGSYDVWLREE